MSEQKKESPVIVLPEDKALRKRLERKCREYKGRVNPCTDPRLQMSAICKHAILEQLLRDGQVRTWDVSLGIANEYPGAYDSAIFNNACAIIDDYCQTGGKNIMGGRGLPTVEVRSSRKLWRGYPPLGERVRLTRDFQVNCVRVVRAEDKTILSDSGVIKIKNTECSTHINPIIPAGAIGIVDEGPFSGIIIEYNFECPVKFIYDPRVPRTIGVPWDMLEFAD